MKSQQMIDEFDKIINSDFGGLAMMTLENIDVAEVQQALNDIYRAVRTKRFMDTTDTTYEGHGHMGHVFRSPKYNAYSQFSGWLYVTIS